MSEINKPLNINKLWAIGGGSTYPGDTKYNLGFVVEAPAYQTHNYLFQKMDISLAHINQHGMAVWDDVTEYQGGKSWTLGTDGSIYYCKITNTNNNPVSDVVETYWTKVLNGSRAINASQVSNFWLSVLDNTNSSDSLDDLGFTSIGKAVINSTTQLAARTAIGVPPASESAEGILPIANNSEVIIGTNDTKAVTPAKLVFGFSVNASINGHIKFPSWLGGVIINWGEMSALATNTAAYPTMSLPFPNACLFGICGLGANTNAEFDEQEAPYCYRVGTTIAIVNPDNTNTSNVVWLSIGR